MMEIKGNMMSVREDVRVLDATLRAGGPVSYTHLDVYKRQLHVSGRFTSESSTVAWNAPCLLYTSKTKGINFGDINKPDYQAKVQRKYGFRDWESVLAAVGHGGLTESQIINRMMEEYRKEHTCLLYTSRTGSVRSVFRSPCPQ